MSRDSSGCRAVAGPVTRGLRLHLRGAPSSWPPEHVMGLAIPVSSSIPRQGPVTPGVPGGLSDREFQIFRTLVAAHSGIALGPHKRALLQARLGRRLRTLGLATFSDYH